MRRSFVVTGIVGALAAAGTIAILVLSVQGAMAVQCEVCMSFAGRSACRSAAGSSPDEAARTATDNACAFLASGMTDSIRCTSTPPTSVTCK
jgi:hypothetical protein